MILHRLSSAFIMCALFTVCAQASGLEASLERYEITVKMESSAVLRSTIHNPDATSIYITGIKVLLSPGASGEVYNPALLHERLHRLDPGQTWGGPLAIVKPNHRGPLLVKGSIQLTGGNTAESTDLLASIPITLTIDDPKRNVDGSYLHGILPVCDRSTESCCDSSEDLCYASPDRCIYVADGYGSQKVCANQESEKSYDHITDLQVSTDGKHLVYLGSFQCQSSNSLERCKRTVVLDHVEQEGPGVPTHLTLSPDGKHYAYVARGNCALYSGKEQCTGMTQPVADGVKVDRLPDWRP